METKGLKAIPFPNVPENLPKHGSADLHRHSSAPSFLKNLKQDDIILLVIIVLLLTDNSCNDKLLLGILILIFISGLDLNLFGR
ncbi:MAG: hypothetical protein GX027_03935 [Clostridiaceae bacterium]|nr:hypothetical protein [Clostridiaceae bacterium]